MTDGDSESTGRSGRSSALRWLGIIAAVAGIVAAAVTVLQWVESRPRNDAAPAPVLSPSPSGAVEGDDRFLQVGQCVRNLGRTENPLMKISECVPGTMRVLAKLEEKNADDSFADAECQRQAPDYTDYHFSTWMEETDVEIIFCLRSQ